jgi:fatty acid synthase
MFQHGLDINISKLYPTISFPVSRSTPMISPLIKWNHSENYSVPLYDSFKRCDKRNIIISLNNPKYEYIQGHTLDGKKR